MTVVIEACCGSVEEAVAAQAAGADRIELCAGLPTGGVTPSLGMLREARAELTIPIVAMVRPREGRACPPDEDFRAAVHDVAACFENGADEVVTGFLDNDATVDRHRNRELIAAAQGRPMAFHRVFDMTPDLSLSLETLVELGFRRVLTSGGERDVDLGFKKLCDLVRLAGDRLTILAGGGLRPHNARALVHEARCRELHFSFRKPTTAEGYGGVPDFEPDRDRISQVRAAIA